MKNVAASQANISSNKITSFINLSSRDIKLLLILLIIAIIAVPYYFLLQPAITKIEGTRSEITSLNTEKSRLDLIAGQIPYYNEIIAAYQTGIEDMLLRYPPDITQKKSIIFINEMERTIPIQLESVSFSAPVTNMITENIAQEAEPAERYEDVTRIGDALSSIKMETTYNFTASYQNLKKFLNYIKTNPESHVIPRVSLSFNAENQTVSGSFSMSSYAIHSVNRLADIIDEPNMDIGKSNIFNTTANYYLY